MLVGIFGNLVGSSILKYLHALPAPSPFPAGISPGLQKESQKEQAPSGTAGKDRAILTMPRSLQGNLKYDPTAHTPEKAVCCAAMEGQRRWVFPL
jgi:hypothetical protein